MFLEYTARGYSVFVVDFGPSLFTELLWTVRRSPCDNSPRANSLCWDTGLHANSNVGPNVSSALVPRGLAGISDGSALLRGHARRTRWRSNWHLFLGQDGQPHTHRQSTAENASLACFALDHPRYLSAKCAKEGAPRGRCFVFAVSAKAIHRLSYLIQASCQHIMKVYPAISALSHR